MWIDIHSHVFPTRAMGSAGKWGPEFVHEGDDIIIRSGSTRWKMPKTMSIDSLSNPSTRAKGMDDFGIDVLGVSAGPQFYLYWIDHDLAVAVARATNDGLAEYCSAHPDKFFFFAHVPLQDVDESVKELDRAAALGARGINMAAEACGHTLEDRYFFPVYRKAVDLDLPIFMHPLALNAIDDPGDRPDDPRYNLNSEAVLSARIGYLYQESATVVKTMMAGVFDEFPTLKFCIPHGGGFIPYQFKRFEMTADKERGASAAKKPLSAYLKNFYFDTIVHDPRARQLMVDVMGVDNVVVGTNFPGWDEGNGFEYVQELALSDDDKAKIMGGNAAKLFKLSGASP
jgi:aminocarboxymuconate-semialdehyde decarboxylase